MGFRVIAAADALKFFKGQDIEVQTAEQGKVPVKDDNGKKVGEKDGLVVGTAKLAVAHVLSAKQYDDGRVTITTIDGQRYEARGKAPAESAAA